MLGICVIFGILGTVLGLGWIIGQIVRFDAVAWRVTSGIILALALVGLVWVALRLDKWVYSEMSLDCPHCHGSLLGSSRKDSVKHAGVETLYTGECPHCRARVLQAPLPRYPLTDPRTGATLSPAEGLERTRSCNRKRLPWEILAAVVGTMAVGALSGLLKSHFRPSLDNGQQALAMLAHFAGPAGMVGIFGTIIVLRHRHLARLGCTCSQCGSALRRVRDLLYCEPCLSKQRKDLGKPSAAGQMTNDRRLEGDRQDRTNE